MNPVINSVFTRINNIRLDELEVMNGRIYRIGFNKHVLSAAGIYSTLHFHTPASPHGVYYTYTTLDRVGEDGNITLIEGGTYTGGTPTTEWNTNRRFKNQASGLTDLKVGVSNVVPLTTIIGGIAAPSRYLAGVVQGAYKAAASAEVGGFIELEPDQDYTVKVTSLTGVITLGMILALVVF
jgi:hypothetical protein